MHPVLIEDHRIAVESLVRHSKKKWPPLPKCVYCAAVRHENQHQNVNMPLDQGKITNTNESNAHRRCSFLLSVHSKRFLRCRMPLGSFCLPGRDTIKCSIAAQHFVRGEKNAMTRSGSEYSGGEACHYA